jgi:hypothetical protein
VHYKQEQCVSFRLGNHMSAILGVYYSVLSTCKVHHFNILCCLLFKMTIWWLISIFRIQLGNFLVNEIFEKDQEDGENGENIM